MNCTKIEFLCHQQLFQVDCNLSSTDTICSVLSIATENGFDLSLIVLERTEKTFARVVVHYIYIYTFWQTLLSKATYIAFQGTRLHSYQFLLSLSAIISLEVLLH